MKRKTGFGNGLGPWILTVFFICTLVWSCQPREPILIGFMAGTSGRVADLGISGRDAVQMAVEQCNEKGGIKGRRVQLLIRDDRQDPETARKAVQELIDQGAAAIVGPMTSDMAVTVAPILDKAGIPAVSPSATTRLLSGRDDYFFRVCSTTMEFATKNAAYHIKTGDMKKICATYDLNNRSFCEDWLKIFTDYFTAHGGEVLFTVGFDTSRDHSFKDLADRLLQHEPDGILVVANSMDSAMFCQRIRKINPDVKITLADWGATERLLELGGKSVEGVTVIQTFNREDTSPSYRTFRKAYFNRFNREPGFPGVHAHDAVNVVLTALKNQQQKESLKETILRLRRFKGMQNDFAFNEFGDVKRGNSSISRVQNQKFVVVD